jgi:hypothetical protein
MPPQVSAPDQPNLGPGKYKNRLLAFADKARASNTNIELTVASLDVWERQIDRFYALANKGIHAEVSHAEARRCFLRTILLLDDIASFRAAPFEQRICIDKRLIESLIQHNDSA